MSQTQVCVTLAPSYRLFKLGEQRICYCSRGSHREKPRNPRRETGRFLPLRCRRSTTMLFIALMRQSSWATGILEVHASCTEKFMLSIRLQWTFFSSKLKSSHEQWDSPRCSAIYSLSALICSIPSTLLFKNNISSRAPLCPKKINVLLSHLVTSTFWTVSTKKSATKIFMDGPTTELATFEHSCQSWPKSIEVNADTPSPAFVQTPHLISSLPVALKVLITYPYAYSPGQFGRLCQRLFQTFQIRFGNYWSTNTLNENSNTQSFLTNLAGI